MVFKNTYGSGSSGNGGNSGSGSYIIKASAEDNGSISPEGNVKVNKGNNKTFTFTPDEGYVVSKVLVDGKNIGTADTYTFENVKSDHTIQVFFSSKDDGNIILIPDGLNSTDHFAYVKGYPDGTVMPEANITRAETASMFYRLLTEERLAEIKTSEHNFTDIPDDAWYREAAATMANGGYITGYDDNTFRGDNKITRSEFVTTLVRFVGVQDAECDFSDVPESHWAYKSIATAVSAGWIKGDDNGTFRPDDSITRAEAMAIINRALNRGVNGDSELLNFKSWSDNPSDKWYYYEVIEASNGHDYTGTRPSENWTKLF